MRVCVCGGGGGGGRLVLGTYKNKALMVTDAQYSRIFFAMYPTKLTGSFKF